jgi:hypothetical protein
VTRVLAVWARNIGAIFYTRGDRKSGAVRPRLRWSPPRALRTRVRGVRLTCAARGRLARAADGAE